VLRAVALLAVDRDPFAASGTGSSRCVLNSDRDYAQYIKATAASITGMPWCSDQLDARSQAAGKNAGVGNDEPAAAVVKKLFKGNFVPIAQKV